MINLLRLSLMFALAVAVMQPRPAVAATRLSFVVVDTDTDSNSGNCTNAANDCPLRRALALVDVGGSITFNGDRNIVLTLGALEVATNGILIEPVGGNNIVINGNNTANVMRITGQDVTIRFLKMFNAGSAFANVWVTSPAKNVLLDRNQIGTSGGGDCLAGESSPNAYGGVYVDSTSALNPGEKRVTMLGNYFACHHGTPGSAVEVFGSGDVRLDAFSDAVTFTRNTFNDNNIGLVIQNSARVDVAWTRFADHQVGVRIQGSSNNTISATDIVGSSGVGLDIIGPGSDANLIGGSGFRGNFIGGNGSHGVQIVNASNTYIVGNFIGASSNGALLSNTSTNANAGDGIRIDGSANTLIGTGSGGASDRNLISNNGGHGIRLTGNTRGTLIKGNVIGANPVITGALPNGGHGVLLSGPLVNGNVIGSESTDTSGNGDTGNVISGNALDGVYITDGANGNVVSGNNIGTDGPLSTPGRAIPNRHGVYISNGAHNNTVGAINETVFANFIAGNTSDGIVISAATTNTIGGNSVGYINNIDLARGVGDSDPVTITNGGVGIRLNNARANRLIRGPVANAIGIRANAHGVVIENGSTDNELTEQATFRNRGHGLLIDGATSTRNVISGSLAFENALDGFADINGATGNVWTHISTIRNGGLGIDRNNDGPTNTPAAPSVVRAGPPDTYTVTFGVPSFTEVQVYSVGNPRDPSGYGEGFIMQARSESGVTGGTVSVRLTNASGSISGCFTLMRITRGGVPQSSEFSRVACAGNSAYLPLTTR